MAALQKTWSGDLTAKIAGEILNAINNYEEEEKLKEASPKVKQAARELRKEDPDVKKVQSPSTAIVVKESLIPVHVKVEQIDKEVKKISGKVTAIGTGLADTNKLIGDQNAMLEAKFDVMLSLLRARGAGEEEIKHGVTGGGGTSGTGAIVPVSKNFGDKIQGLGMGFLTRAYAGKIIKRTLKFLRRRIIPRRLRAGARLLRMKGKQFLRPITRQLSKVRPRNLMRKAAQRFATSGIGRKLTQKLGIKTATRIGSKTAAKSLAKKIPFIGALAGTGFAIQRAMKGEWGAAGLEFASGIASIFPGIGTGISVGLDAGLMAYDINKEMKPKTPVVPEREMGSGTDVMGIFKQASSLLLSSMIPIAASAGTLPEVKGQIKAAGLDDVQIARMQPPTGINIGRGGKAISMPTPPEPTTPKIPSLPKLPSLDGGDNRNPIQKAWDGTTNFLGNMWKGIEGGFVNSIKQISKVVSAGYNFVDEKADAIRNVDVAGFGVGGERGDGKITLMRTPWGNVEFGNPFAKKEETNVKPETVAIPNGSSYSGPWKPLLDLISSGEGTYDSMYPSESYPEMLDMDIRTELVAFQKQKLKDGRKSVAVGRYQFMYPEVEADRAGLPKGAKFTPENQHKMAIAILEKKRRGKEWMDGKISNAEFSEELAREWGTFKSKSGFVLPGNNGKIDFEQMKPIFEKIKSSGVSPETPSAEKGAILSSNDVSMKSHQIQQSSAVVDEIEDQVPPQPIVYLSNNNISTKPLVIVKKKSNMNDFVEQYRFMSLGAA